LRPSYAAVDFETDPIPFFEKKGRSQLNWSGHPRLAIGRLISIKDEKRCAVWECVSPETIPLVTFLIFHNASFDIQVGINAGVWHESNFA